MEVEKTRAQILGANLERIRKEKGFSRKQLAEKLGVGADLIGLYENGRRLPPLDKIFNIANLLETSVTSLIGENSYNAEVPNIAEIVDQKIFEYRYKRAVDMTSTDLFFPTTELDNGNISVYIPNMLKRDEDGTLSFGLGKQAIFRDKQVFVDCIEKAERASIDTHITFYKALEIVLDNVKET